MFKGLKGWMVNYLTIRSYLNFRNDVLRYEPLNCKNIRLKRMTAPKAVFWVLFGVTFIPRSILLRYLSYSLVCFKKKFIAIMVLNYVAYKIIRCFLTLTALKYLEYRLVFP